jgi:hypothetical protein
VIRRSLARFRSWWWLQAYDAGAYLFGFGSSPSLWVLEHASSAEYARFDMRPEAYPDYPLLGQPALAKDLAIILATAPVWAMGFAALALAGWWAGRERRERG